MTLELERGIGMSLNHKEIPDYVASELKLDASFNGLENVDDARAFVQKYLYSLSGTEESSEQLRLQEIAKNQLMMFIYNNSPENPPTLKEAHPSRRRYDAANYLTVAMEEYLGREIILTSDSDLYEVPRDYVSSYKQRVHRLRRLGKIPVFDPGSAA